MKVLSKDSLPVMLLKRFFKFMLLGLLWVAASLPVVTFGAATTAMFFTADSCILKDEDKVFSVFQKAFCREFKQATLLSFIAAATGACLVLEVHILSTWDIPDAAAGIMLICFVVLFSWLQLWFGYLSKFNNTIGALLLNTFGMFFGRFFWVLLLAIIGGAAILGVYASVKAGSLLILLIPGVYGMLASLVLRMIFRKYILAAQNAAE